MISLPSSLSVARLSDWVELYLLWEGISISKSRLISLLEDETGTADETKVDSVFAELDRRLRLYGTRRPYRINGATVHRLIKWSRYPEHTLSVIYSTYSAETPDSGTQYFEHITKLCVEVALNCKAYRFGFPNSKTLVQQLDEFALLIKEPRIGNPAATANDRGVDIVAYKQLDDARENAILVFIQCAAGKHWFRKKRVPISSFRRYLNFDSDSAIAAVSSTHVIALGSKWTDAIDDYGVIIDRARLYKIISSPQFTANVSLRNSVTKWCRKQLS
jgi:hypothetical protein